MSTRPTKLHYKNIKFSIEMQILSGKDLCPFENMLEAGHVVCVPSVP